MKYFWDELPNEFLFKFLQTQISKSTRFSLTINVNLKGYAVYFLFGSEHLIEWTVV